MKKTRLACSIVVFSLLTGNVMANELNPWKHCGIGAMIFDDNGTAAAISNIIFDLGTTAVSSKISSASACEGKRVKVAMFIQDHFDKVIEETSQGSGEHLNAMLTMLEVTVAAQPQTILSIRDDVAADVASHSVTPESYYQAVVSKI